MVRGNHTIIKNHFHKKWQVRVKTHFNQPMKKLARRQLRLRIRLSNLPRPVCKLRPSIHCPTVRYNVKSRSGRGFTLDELRAAGMNKKFASTIGISVDYRRKNKSFESLKLNAFRLKEYQNKLILNPKNDAKVKYTQNLPMIKRTERIKQKAHVPLNEEKRFQAFATLSKARNEVKDLRKAMKKKRLLIPEL